MPKQTRRGRMTELTFREIKLTAQKLMHEHGTSGLSIRAIARDMDITPPAIYHYFPSLEDLITALIVDSFTAYAQAVDDAHSDAVTAGYSLSQQMLAITNALWRWAIDNPVNFQLIFGNPIPGYHAPDDITIPLARAIGTAAFGVALSGLKQNMINVPESLKQIPPTVQARYRHRLETDDETMMLAHHLVNTLWVGLFGVIMLHINNHLQPVVGDVEQFFQQQTNFLLRSVGYDL